MNCVIVDDEKLARDVLEHYVLKTPQLQLTGQMSNALDLFRHLHSDAQTDLVFLDIKMPEMTGLELVAALKQVPHIIFTTAYHEYALDAFNLNAIDYLLKPFSYERFLQAVSKAMRHKQPLAAPAAVEKAESFFVKSDKKLVQIDPTDLLYIEGLKNYFTIVSQSAKSTIVHNTLSYLDNALARYPHIVRVHRSFFVNIHAIKEIFGNDVRLINNKEIPISQMYRANLMSKLNLL